MITHETLHKCGTPAGSVKYGALVASEIAGLTGARDDWAVEAAGFRSYSRLEDRQLLATFTVSNTLDVVTGGNPANGSLRWAVQQADLAGGTGIVNFSPSVFNTPQTITLTQLLTPIQMTTGAPTITINGPGINLLTINGGNDGSVFQVNSGVAATIKGMTITGASLGDNGAIDDLGSLNLNNCVFNTNTISGVYVASTAAANISNCVFENDNSYFGAGIYINGGTATITNCTLSGNTGAVGGGICNVKGTATVTNCTISGNSTLGGGGGLYNSGQLTVTDSTISGNSGGGGGSLYNKSGTATLTGCTITGGWGFIDGGNLDNQKGATLNLSYCQVSGGVAEIGSGLYNEGTANITNCTISGNNATGSSGGGQGGGIANGINFLATSAVLNLTDSTLADNTAKLGGGGLYNAGTATLTACTIANNYGDNGGSLLASNGGAIDDEGTVTLIACTVSGNSTTDSGGGIYAGPLGPDVVKLYDTIVAGNWSTTTSAVASDIALYTGLGVSGSYNLIGPGGAGGITGTGNIILTSLAGLDLAPLADYGGSTATMALESGSVAIGAGSSNISGVSVPRTDQRGFPLDAPHPDIGAYQAVSFPLVVDVTTDGAVAPSAALDLRAAVNLANLTSAAEEITFSPTAFGTIQTIVLADGPLVLSNGGGAIIINGPSAGVTISGDDTTGVFKVLTGTTASISGLTIAAGSATNGGGLYNQGDTQLTDCTVSGNFAASNGGGLFNSGTLVLTDCTISGNSAVAGGGGLANSGTSQLYSCTLSGNTATVGGGIDNVNTATATLDDTIVAANAGPGVAPSDIGGNHAAAVTGTFNLVGIGGSGGITNGSGNNIVLSDLTGLGLAPLGNYGGSTQTIALLPGSLAIAAGTSEIGTVTDQRGKPLDSPNPDIGAFQSQGFLLTPASGSTPQTTTTGSNFANPLSVMVTAKNPIEPVAGGIVKFTVGQDSNGASATLSAATATIGSGGIALVNATANAVAGSYTATASAIGAGIVDFDLTNLYLLTFSGVTDQSITYGTSSVTVAGTLADGSEIPVGETVTITLDGTELAPTIDSNGDFAALFDTSSFTVLDSPYTISLSYTSDGTFTSATTSIMLTVTRATPTVSVSDAGGTYNNTPFPATANIAGISGPPSASLEGIGLTLDYYSGAYTDPSQLTNLTPLSSAPSTAGSYTVLASFAGSTDYAGASQLANFPIAQAMPTVTVTDAGGIYKGTAYTATDSIEGVTGTAGGSLEGVNLALSYYSGTYTSASELTGLTPLSAAPSAAGDYTAAASFPGSRDYLSTTQLVDYTILQATPTVAVADAGGTYTGTAFAATASVKGISGSPGSSLEGISLVLSYYGGTYTDPSQLTGLTPLSGAPSAAGAYTAVASFPGSTDYSSNTQLADFTILQAMPTVTVTAAGGTFNARLSTPPTPSRELAARPARAWKGSVFRSITTVEPTRALSELTGLTPLSGAPSAAGAYTAAASFPGLAHYSIRHEPRQFHHRPGIADRDRHGLGRGIQWRSVCGHGDRGRNR